MLKAMGLGRRCCNINPSRLPVVAEQKRGYPQVR